MRWTAALFIILVCAVPSWAGKPPQAEHVIIISFDGLRPDAITALGPNGAPNFHELLAAGAATLNARTDPDWTVTMPNHVCMLTGRGVEGSRGHQYKDNASSSLSIHDVRGDYVASIFDVAAEHQLSTAFFASKDKFRVFLHSYEKSLGYSSVNQYDDHETLKLFVDRARLDLANLTFIHFAGADHTGHRNGWSLDKNSPYLNAVTKMDGYLGEIVGLIRANPAYAQSTVLMITSDHGGRGMGHGDQRRPENYRVPLIIWGKGVATGADLYRINIGIRRDPRDRQVPYSESLQPIRNGDVANAALRSLGLPLIPGSTIGNPKPLKISPGDKRQ